MTVVVLISFGYEDMKKAKTFRSRVAYTRPQLRLYEHRNWTGTLSRDQSSCFQLAGWLSVADAQRALPRLTALQEASASHSSNSNRQTKRTPSVDTHLQQDISDPASSTMTQRAMEGPLWRLHSPREALELKRRLADAGLTTPSKRRPSCHDQLA
ncbi:Uncharacterized protein HZ326_15707 [Fusarium oxysporum f. sp. albedinis]|nr:Uncharacterized protein HZ326_15707 [Fusarium oxysporum f. sp. albedinis]